MGLPEVSLGVIPDRGTQRLSQLVGKGKAFEMILSAKMINTQDALKWGLLLRSKARTYYGVMKFRTNN